jgi:general secretion pathway protein D
MQRFAQAHPPRLIRTRTFRSWHPLVPLSLLACLATIPLSAGAQANPAPTQSSTPAKPNSKPDPERAEQAYLAGARAIDRKDFAAAQAEFTRAVALNPSRQTYSLALDLTRQGRIAELLQQAAKARLLDHPTHATELLAEAQAIDPHNDAVIEHLNAAQQAEQPRSLTAIPAKDLAFAPPIEVAPNPGSHDLHLRGDAKQVVAEAARAFGIKAVADDSVSAQQLRFTLDDTSYAQAMPILLRMAHLFAVVLDPKTILVLKDTQDNRQRFERQVEETIFAPGSTKEQLTELQNIVKNVFDVKQASLQENASSLVVRAPEPTLKAVNATLAGLVDDGAEVVLELKLYNVDKSLTRNLGLNTPTSVGAFSIAAEAQSIVSANQSTIQEAISQGLFTPTGTSAQIILEEALFLIASGLATDSKVAGLIGTVGGGLTSAGIYLGSTTTLNIALNSSDSRALDDITIRAGDRQTSTMKIGSKYPITTSTYSSGVSSATSSALAGISIGGQSASSLLNQYLGSAASQTIPQITYEDLGLTLKTTPTVLKSGLISLHVDIKIEALTGTSNDNIPILTDTSLTSDVTVPDGQTALMLSQLSTTESAAISGIPGLADLPGFQESLADRLAETAHSELVLMITPHLVRRRPNLIAGPPIAFRSNVPAEF